MKKPLLKIQILVLLIYTVLYFGKYFGLMQAPVESWNLNRSIGWGNSFMNFLIFKSSGLGLISMMGLVILLLLGEIKKITLASWISILIIITSILQVVTHFSDFIYLEIPTFAMLILFSIGIFFKIIYTLFWK